MINKIVHSKQTKTTYKYLNIISLKTAKVAAENIPAEPIMNEKETVINISHQHLQQNWLIGKWSAT